MAKSKQGHVVPARGKRKRSRDSISSSSSFSSSSSSSASSSSSCSSSPSSSISLSESSAKVHAKGNSKALLSTTRKKKNEKLTKKSVPMAVHVPGEEDVVLGSPEVLKREANDRFYEYLLACLPTYQQLQQEHDTPQHHELNQRQQHPKLDTEAEITCVGTRQRAYLHKMLERYPARFFISNNPKRHEHDKGKNNQRHYQTENDDKEEEEGKECYYYYCADKTCEALVELTANILKYLEARTRNAKQGTSEPSLKKQKPLIDPAPVHKKQSLQKTATKLSRKRKNPELEKKDNDPPEEKEKKLSPPPKKKKKKESRIETSATAKPESSLVLSSQTSSTLRRKSTQRRTARTLPGPTDVVLCSLQDDRPANEKFYKFLVSRLAHNSNKDENNTTKSTTTTRRRQRRKIQEILQSYPARFFVQTGAQEDDIVHYPDRTSDSLVTMVQSVLELLIAELQEENDANEDTNNEYTNRGSSNEANGKKEEKAAKNNRKDDVHRDEKRKKRHTKDTLDTPTDTEGRTQGTSTNQDKADKNNDKTMREHGMQQNRFVADTVDSPPGKEALFHVNTQCATEKMDENKEEQQQDVDENETRHDERQPQQTNVDIKGVAATAAKCEPPVTLPPTPDLPPPLVVEDAEQNDSHDAHGDDCTTAEQEHPNNISDMNRSTVAKETTEHVPLSPLPNNHTHTFSGKPSESLEKNSVTKPAEKSPAGTANKVQPVKSNHQLAPVGASDTQKVSPDGLSLQQQKQNLRQIGRINKTPSREMPPSTNMKIIPHKNPATFNNRFTAAPPHMGVYGWQGRQLFNNAVVTTVIVPTNEDVILESPMVGRFANENFYNFLRWYLHYFKGWCEIPGPYGVEKRRDFVGWLLSTYPGRIFLHTGDFDVFMRDKRNDLLVFATEKIMFKLLSESMTTPHAYPPDNGMKYPPPPSRPAASQRTLPKAADCKPPPTSQKLQKEAADRMLPEVKESILKSSKKLPDAVTTAVCSSSGQDAIKPNDTDVVFGAQGMSREANDRFYNHLLTTCLAKYQAMRGEDETKQRDYLRDVLFEYPARFFLQTRRGKNGGPVFFADKRCDRLVALTAKVMTFLEDYSKANQEAAENDGVLKESTALYPTPSDSNSRSAAASPDVTVSDGPPCDDDVIMGTREQGRMANDRFYRHLISFLPKYHTLGGDRLQESKFIGEILSTYPARFFVCRGGESNFHLFPDKQCAELVALTQKVLHFLEENVKKTVGDVVRDGERGLLSDKSSAGM